MSDLTIRAIEKCKLEFLNTNVQRHTKTQTLADRSFAKGWNACNRQWMSEILKLSSVQPKQKKGEWIQYLSEGLRYKCSECESRYETPWRFCPNCGSYNRGGQDE